MSATGAYQTEAAALDRRILATIAACAAGGTLAEAEFDALAREIFAHQLRYNAPYAAYARSRGYTLERLPESWRAIPAVPSAAFKEAALCTFSPERAALRFVTSGTTQGRGGEHYLETAELYRASLLAGFDAYLLPDRARLRYLNLVPDPRERPTSSLGYMMRAVAEARGDGAEAWYLHGDALDLDGFARDLEAACAAGIPVGIAGTAFAFVAVVDGLGSRTFRAPAGSRIMETGGFKGRSRQIGREELYRELSARFGIPVRAIVAEYGMTELCAQYYDAVESRDAEPRVKVGPPWLRPLIVDVDGAEVPAGTVGALRHVDLSNRSSVVSIETEDLGYARGGGFVLLGRDAGAELRGCSLEAEDLDVARP